VSFPDLLETPTVSESRYQQAVDLYLGWCCSCHDFTREQTEPDAEEFDCPSCTTYSVFGAEQALVMEMFVIGDDDGDALDADLDLDDGRDL
jgi:hypothetical protein